VNENWRGACTKWNNVDKKRFGEIWSWKKGWMRLEEGKEKNANGKKNSAGNGANRRLAGVQIVAIVISKMDSND
jgi:hypothetical protein